MMACTYVNLAAGTLLLGLSTFAACGGAQSTPASPSSESAPPADPVASASAPSVAPPASASAPASLAASPPEAAPAAPDRNMDDIRAIVAGNRDTFRACYDRSLKAHPGIKGRFMLKFVVNPDGTVKSAEADATKSEIHASDLESCAIGALKGLKFPPSKKGMESTVNYPFDFNPKGPPPKTGAP